MMSKEARMQMGKIIEGGGKLNSSELENVHSGIESSNSIVSIIVPVYNTAPLLRRCIYSLINQTYKELEIICVDDGSMDTSGQILDEIAQKDPRVKVVHTENRGCAAARNTALSIASGTYIGFFDSDDYANEKMYELMVGCILIDNVDFVSCGYCLDNGEYVKRALNREKIPKEPINIEKFLYYMHDSDNYKGVGLYLWNKLFKKELIYEHGRTLRIRFCEDLDVGEDALFLAEICKNACKVTYMNEALYYYVQRKDSASHELWRQCERRSAIRAYERIIELYKGMGVSEDVIDLVIKLYVYDSGRLLEIIREKENTLKSGIKSHLSKYVRMNYNYLDRIQWILELLA